jgi:uncharacterized protein YqhQ
MERGLEVMITHYLKLVVKFILSKLFLKILFPFLPFLFNHLIESVLHYMWYYRLSEFIPVLRDFLHLSYLKRSTFYS